MIIEVREELQELRSEMGSGENSCNVGAKRRKLNNDSDYEDKLSKIQADLKQVHNFIGTQTEKRDSIKDLVIKRKLPKYRSTLNTTCTANFKL